MLKKKSLFKKKPQNEEMALQITSMADIFTIILVFLLKGYATSAVNITPSKGVTLPAAQVESAPAEALKVEISESAVQVEGVAVATLSGFGFERSDLLPNGSSQVLGKALEKERQRQLLIAKSNSDVKVDPKILVIADQRAPYSTIKAVLASAALNGYTDFKLAVVKGD
jgi:biopolymer transport protein ExbD